MSINTQLISNAANSVVYEGNNAKVHIEAALAELGKREPEVPNMESVNTWLGNAVTNVQDVGVKGHAILDEIANPTG